MKCLPLLIIVASWAQARPTSERLDNALYFLDSDPQGASVVSFKIARNGSLGRPFWTSTGGNGLIGRDANGSVTADPLFSQGSIIVDGNRLFTVNAGSNTLAAFHIPEDDPAHPVLVGEPVNTVGTTPNTVAYSRKHKIACVANTGTKPGVQCFKVSGYNDIEPGLQTPLQISFSTPSETALFVSLKGNGMGDGYIYAYPIDNGAVSEKAVESRPENLPIAFGMSFTDDRSAIVSTPKYGAALVSIAEDFNVTTNTIFNITGQKATCWTAKSAETGSVYLLDAGVASITAVNTDTEAPGHTLPGYQQGMGNFDGIISGSKLYVLQATAAIAIFDLKDPSSGPQAVDLEGFGNRASWTGMAIYS